VYIRKTQATHHSLLVYCISKTVKNHNIYQHISQKNTQISTTEMETQQPSVEISSSPSAATPSEAPMMKSGGGKKLMNYGGGKRGLGKGKCNLRHRNKPQREVIQGVTKPAIRRLARRAGVKRISGHIYEESRGVLKVLTSLSASYLFIRLLGLFD
jgi:hypothetical protein